MKIKKRKRKKEKGKKKKKEKKKVDFFSWGKTEKGQKWIAQFSRWLLFWHTD